MNVALCNFKIQIYFKNKQKCQVKSAILIQRTLAVLKKNFFFFLRSPLQIEIYLVYTEFYADHFYPGLKKIG